MNLRLPMFVLLALSTLAISNAVSEDWPQWRGPDRNGKAASKGLLSDWNNQKPKLLWMTDGMGKGYASVSIMDNTLYTTGDSDQGQAVVAVDLKTQDIKWKELVTAEVPEHGYQGARSTPTIDGDLLYVMMSNGTLACLNRADGKVQWKHNLQEEYDATLPKWGFAESPLVDGDRVIVGCGSADALLICFDKESGKEIWKTAKGRTDLGTNGKDEAGYSSVKITTGGGIKQYVKLIGRGLIGVDARNGRLLWNYNPIANDVANIPDPIIAGDYIFTSTGYQTGAALLKLQRSGRSVNAQELYFLEPNKFQNHHGGMIQIGRYVYAGTKHNQGFPICIDMENGETKWGGDFRGVGKGSAAILLVDGKLIFRYQSGELALIEATPKEYNLLGSFKPEYQEGNSWAHPVVVDGLLYLREQDKLMCYDLQP